MNKSLLGVIIAVVIVVAGVMLFRDNAAAPTTPAPSPAPAPSPTPTPNPTEVPPPAPNPASVTPKTYDVAISDAGYTPSALTIKKGDTVKFTNNGTRASWPASAPHPTHTDYPEFDPKKGIAAGSSWSFTFDKVGNWRYHDHLNPTHFGSVKVE